MNAERSATWWGAPRQRWYLWIGYTSVWTILLLVPLPSDVLEEVVAPGFEIDIQSIVADLAHLSANALMAYLAGWMRVAQRWRWLLVFLLMMHGSLIEAVQPMVGRYGAISDILLDHMGVAVGMLASLSYWLSPDRQQ